MTNSGYIDHSPQWAMDGNAIIFISNRLGLRAHASWGSQDDVFIAFMNRDTYDKFNMSEEEYALYKEKEEAAEKKAKEAEEAEKEKASKDKKGKKDADDAEEETDESKDIEIDFAGLEHRIMRLTPMSSTLASAALTGDGESLYFLSAFEEGFDLWELETRTGAVSLLKKLNTSYFNMSMELDRAAERAYMMDHVFKQEEKKFYTDTYHGVDLKQLRKDYLPFLEHINNNYDFSEMLSEILGELNVSHTGSGYSGRGAEKTTPALGLLLDMRYTGDGLRRRQRLESKGRCHPGSHRRRENTRRRGLVPADQRQTGRSGALLVL